MGKETLKAAKKIVGAMLFVSAILTVLFSANVYAAESVNYNFSVNASTDRWAYDNDNLDAGEGIPPTDWTDLSGLTPWDACYQPNRDADELTAGSYTSIGSENQVFYTFRGSKDDYACVGTNWTIYDDPTEMIGIKISTKGYMQTSGDSIAVYMRNWTGSKWAYVGAWTFTSTSSPGEFKNLTVTGNISNYIKSNKELRAMFIVAGTNKDYYSDYVYLNFTISTQGPTFTNPNFNETIINSGGTVRFNITATDQSGVDTVNATFRLPDATKVNVTLSPGAGDVYTYVWTDTTIEGTYNVTQVWANDTKGNINTNENEQESTTETEQ